MIACCLLAFAVTGPFSPATATRPFGPAASTVAEPLGPAATVAESPGQAGPREIKAEIKAEIKEVSIASAGAKTEITILADGDLAVRHSMLGAPPRLILDIEGASRLGRYSYTGIWRGGVIRMRWSDFRPGSIRLVFDLAEEVDYQVADMPGAATVTFQNPGRSFPRWSTEAKAERAASAESSRAVAGEPLKNSVGQLRALGSPVEEWPGAAIPEDGGSPRGESGSQLPSGAPMPRGVMALPGFAGEGPPLISVMYDSAGMLDVLAGFAEFAGISIVPNGEIASVIVRGIDIRNQQWDIALSAILSAQNLGWHTTESGILVVDRLENLRERDQLLRETRVMQINYASADSVAETLRQLATPDRGKVVSFAGANTVIVTDAPSVVSRMDTIVAKLDRRLPQVAIEAKIVFVDRSDVQELGIVYDLKDRAGDIVEQGINRVIPVPDARSPPQLVDTDGDRLPDRALARPTNETIVSLGGSAIAALANANGRLLAPALQILTTVVFGDFSLFSFIEALESHQLSDVQAAPSIQVVDNARARIQVGERTPLRVLEQGAETREATVNVQFEDTGVILEVVPHVTNNNQIRLELLAERSGLKAGPSDVGFVFEKQVGETTILLEDGETAVIGGLTLNELTRSESGIPGLMHLPFIGALFRTTKEREVKQDLIILITPHIIGRGAP